MGVSNVNFLHCPRFLQSFVGYMSVCLLGYNMHVGGREELPGVTSSGITLE